MGPERKATNLPLIRSQATMIKGIFSCSKVSAWRLSTRNFCNKPTNLISITNRCAHITYNELSLLKANGANVLIKPDLKNATIFDDSKNWSLYEAGKKAALEKIEEIKKLLKQ